MSTRRSLRIAGLVALIVSALMAGTAVASPPDRAQSEHQRIIDFWTPARVAAAVPRDFVRMPDGTYVPAKQGSNPGRGRPGTGSGGGGSDLVTGASWTGSPAVQKTTGKVLFSIGSSYYVCSASVTDDAGGSESLILTAGHCAYDETGGHFVENWVFIPDYDAQPVRLTTDRSYCSQTAFGCWTAAALTVDAGFAGAGGFNDQAVVNDFAVVTVGAGGLSGNAQLDVTVGTQGHAFDTPASDAIVYAFGYPAAKKYKGNDLVYCSGPFGYDPNVGNGASTYRIECDMTGGSSGGPWFGPFSMSDGAGTQRSLNSYGYTGDSGMYGPVFNSDTKAVYDAAAGATANGVIDPATGSITH